VISELTKVEENFDNKFLQDDRASLRFVIIAKSQNR